MKNILLSNGMIVVVDDDDYERVADYKWCTSECNNYYVTTGYKGVGLILHRLILDAPSHLVVDHINGNPLDNRRCNIRLATQRQNAKNRPPHPKRKYKGVWKSVKAGAPPYEAMVYADGRRRHVGFFHTPEETARAYDAAAIKYHGEFARLNFPLGYDYLPDRIIEEYLAINRGPVKHPNDYTLKELRDNQRLFVRRTRNDYKNISKKG